MGLSSVFTCMKLSLLCRLVWILFSPTNLENLVWKKLVQPMVSVNICLLLYWSCISEMVCLVFFFNLLIHLRPGLWVMLWNVQINLVRGYFKFFLPNFYLHSFNCIIYTNFLLYRSSSYFRNLTVCALCLELSWILKENFSGFRKFVLTTFCT